MSKPFVQLPDDPAAAADLVVALADQDHQDMGAPRAVFRAWPGTVFWVVAGVVVVAATGLALLTPNPDDRLWLAALAGGTFLAWSAVFAGVGVAERHRVCEHGLVLGWRTRSRYVVPWSSVDPGRVRVVHRSNFVSRLKDMPPSSPHYRVGMVSGTALALNGFDSAVEGWHRVPGVLEVTDARTPGSRWRRTPFVWWLLGTRRPEALVRAIEDAMVADGYDARGMADRAIAQARTLRWGDDDRPHPFPVRDATDPVIGVAGPPLP